MKDNHQRPFQNMTSSQWQNLALVGLITFNILLIGSVLFNVEMCGNVANDYCAYWSVGKVINNYGFSEIYDIDRLAEYQKQIYPQGNDPSFNVVPVPYFPVFVIPFQTLSLLNLPIGYLIWEIINLLGFFFYLRFFTKKVTGQVLPIKTLILFTLSWQVILDLFYGQVNIVLMIFTGEFIRAILTNKPVKAGLWLGGLLLKPQLLILVLPFLLLQRRFKAILGFFTSAVSILAVSFALLKLDGFLSLVDLLLRYSRGAPTNSVPIMMNWRMLGWHISNFINTTLGWVILIIGSLLTLAAPFYAFRRKLITDPTKQVIALLGVFAATCATTWHAHLPMSIVLIPLLIYLYFNDQMDFKVILSWILLPIFAQFIGYFVGVLITYNILQINILPNKVIQIFGGMSGFILNLGLLCWAFAIFRHPK